MAKDDSMPDISSMKLVDIKKELRMYGIDSDTFVEKEEFKRTLDNARKTLPRPTTTYHEVEKEKPEPEPKSKSSRPSKRSEGRNKTSSSTPTSSRRPASTPPAPPPAPIPPAPSPAPTNGNRPKISMAARSPVVALQQIKEHPSEKVIGERNHSFLAGACFSFALKGSRSLSDAAIVRIPDGVCLRISSASTCRKQMETFLLQKGSIGVSLRVASEDNPELLPIWTFHKDRSTGYSVTDLGIEVSGPRTIRLLAYMEMGYSSKASVDVNLFGAVKLDADKM